MTLYFERAVNFTETSTISTNAIWHPSAPLLAVASYSQEKGGFVTIFDEFGESLPDISYPYHPVSQVTALVWHPERNVLVSGWENAEIKLWNGQDKEFVTVNGPHKGPVIILAFSEKGGRFVSCDSTGSLVGWKVDSKGQAITVFHHEIKESITHVTFRLSTKNPDFDLEGLAKAAVNGDEQALDIFSNWRPKTTARKFRIQNESDNQCFFIGTQEGNIYYVNQVGACTEVLNTEGVPLTYILYNSTRDILVVMLEGLIVGHFSVDSEGRLRELSKVKLSGRSQSFRGTGSQGLIWAGKSSLAIMIGDLTVRIWDVDTNDNYVLPTTLNSYTDLRDKERQINEMFTCLAYCPTSQTLCGGTNIGRIYFWTKKGESDREDHPEDSWELHNVNAISGTVKQIAWASVNLRLPLLSVNCVTKVYIMREQNICVCYSEKVWVTQKTANQVLIESADCNLLQTLNEQVTDISCNECIVAFTNGRSVSTYEIMWRSPTDRTSSFELNNKLSEWQEKSSKISLNLVATFSCDSEKILVHRKSVIALYVSGITMYSVSGKTLTRIPVVDNEDEPIGMDICGNILTIFTMEGFLKIYDLTDHEMKLLTTCNMYDTCNDFGEIMQAKSNVHGRLVALTVAAANLMPDGKLYIWNVENDNFFVYDFQKYKNSLNFDINSMSLSFDDSEDSILLYDKICHGRIPLSVYWDCNDPRLLVCSAKKLKSPNKNKGTKSLYKKLSQTAENKTDINDEEKIIVTMFISTEHGIKIQDVRAIAADAKLLSVAAPFLITLQKLNIVREVLNGFAGLQNCNKATKDAVLDFSYNLSLGNMDAAFKAIKLVHNVNVWNSLARMCVKTRRLDVAGVCLGHMGNARAAKALREATSDDSLPLEAKLAILAVQLDMIEEAEQLYVECERYDLLNKLYQSQGKLDQALKIAESKDRINFRNTSHMYAKSLEEEGNFEEAVIHYEKANTCHNIPRMLLNRPQQLEVYMEKTTDVEMLKWWGQYMESQGDLHTALKIYVKAGDIYSQVRVLCFMNEETDASELAKRSNDKGALYHMARYYETLGNTEEAVMFFTKANAYSNAVRLCKENHLVEELWNIGIVAGNREKIECAQYFEQQDMLEKAVLLYHRAGMLHKALDLAFRTQQFDTLQQIATDLDSDSDPALLLKCAEYFVSNKQFDKAVNLLAIGKEYKKALDICLNHDVPLTEELAEKLTPDKNQLDEQTRNEVLELVAENLFIRGNYHLATKKFTQAGNKIKAMKALLKSGDTDKIIFFTGVSRQKEIYIMAANYLQSLNWQNRPEILRHIITFYSKGKTFDLLANFYVACAQVEIDEFQNYEKAFGALTEASRCLVKVTTPKDPNQHRKAIDIVQQRLTTVKRFIDVKQLFDSGELVTGMNQCRQLLTSGGQELEVAVRRGDIYALMIQTYVKNENFPEARKVFVELTQLLSTSRNVNVTYYVSKDVIDSLARGLGIPVNVLLPTVKTKMNEDEGKVDDEVVDETVA